MIAIEILTWVDHPKVPRPGTQENLTLKSIPKLFGEGGHTNQQRTLIKLGIWQSGIHTDVMLSDMPLSAEKFARAISEWAPRRNENDETRPKWRDYCASRLKMITERHEGDLTGPHKWRAG